VHIHIHTSFIPTPLLFISILLDLQCRTCPHHRPLDQHPLDILDILNGRFLLLSCYPLPYSILRCIGSTLLSTTYTATFPTNRRITRWMERLTVCFLDVRVELGPSLNLSNQPLPSVLPYLKLWTLKPHHETALEVSVWLDAT
jgi:hypothetical protein